MEYLARVADQTLQDRLEAFGAVLIEGPKWTGKTTTAEQQDANKKMKEVRKLSFQLCVVP